LVTHGKQKNKNNETENSTIFKHIIPY